LEWNWNKNSYSTYYFYLYFIHDFTLNVCLNLMNAVGTNWSRWQIPEAISRRLTIHSRIFCAGARSAFVDASFKSNLLKVPNCACSVRRVSVVGVWIWFTCDASCTCKLSKTFENDSGAALRIYYHNTASWHYRFLDNTQLQLIREMRLHFGSECHWHLSSFRNRKHLVWSSVIFD